MATTLPGQVVTAYKYHDYMVLYTAGEPVHAVVDGAPPGPNGRLFNVDPGKAVKVPYEAGRFLCEHLGYTGVVRVDEHEREDGTGTEFDIEKARAESLTKFEAEDARRWRDYVQYCIEDKINNKRAVPATPDTIKAIIQRRGYRLADYGIAPIGEIQPADAAMKQLQELVASQAASIAALTAKLNDALGEPEDKKGKK